MLLASADAVLRDYRDVVINRMQLPWPFYIKGKAVNPRPVKPRKALTRAEKGVFPQQRSKHCTAHLNNLLGSDIHKHIVATGITPVVPLPPGDDRQPSDSVLRLLSPPTSGNGGQQLSSIDTTAEILSVVDPFWDIASLPPNAPPPIMTSTSQHVVQPSNLGFNLHDIDKVMRLVEADANQHYIVPDKVMRLQVYKYTHYKKIERILPRGSGR